jgi:hypothetical protein
MELVVAGGVAPNAQMLGWIRDSGSSSSNLQKVAHALLQAVRESPASVAGLLQGDEHSELRSAVDAPVDAHGFRALHAASALNNAAFDALLAAGADVQARAATGETPLHALLGSSVRLGDNLLARVRLLLDKGADPCAADEKGTTPLQMACMQWSAPLVKLLIERGADPNAVDSAGISCLISVLLPHLSVYYSNWNQLMVGEEKGSHLETHVYLCSYQTKISKP